MLASSRERPFSAAGWRFEIKLDGYRLLAGLGAAAEGDARVTLITRGGHDWTDRFPELAAALAAALPDTDAVLDGEVTVLDASGRPSFSHLQGQRGAGTGLTYFVFDLLSEGGEDLRPLPLAERSERLRSLLASLDDGGPVRRLDHVAERGEEVFARLSELGLEGMMAKRDDSPYVAGRSDAWVKVRAGRSGRFLVVGWLGTTVVDELVLAELQVDENHPDPERALTAGRLVSVGRVGTGLVPHERRRLADALAPLARETSPISGRPGRHSRDVHWLEPRRVAEVRFAERTGAGRLRHPVFVRLVEDAGPEDCVRALPGPGTASATPPDLVQDTVPPAWHDKVYFPDSGITKADLHAYYLWAAPHILPYLRDRPVVLERFPEGIASGTRFFQKNAPEGLPGFVRVEHLPSGRRALVCDDTETLLYLVSLATIPLHIEASRLAEPGRPDWASLDLDAKSAPFTAAREVARAVRSLTDRIGLASYVKTSGATGLHVLLPLGGRLDHLQARQLAELLARVVVAELEAAGRPIASVERSPGARTGRVYVDFLQNGAGKLLAAPWCVRALPGAPVSTPLAWEELDDDLEPGDFTLETVPARVESLDADPWADLFDQEPDVVRALDALGGIASQVT